MVNTTMPVIGYSLPAFYSALDAAATIVVRISVRDMTKLVEERSLGIVRSVS